MAMDTMFRPTSMGWVPSWTGGMGRVYWVDGDNGNDGNTGVDPADPLQSITYALTLCEARRNDYILVKNLWTIQEAQPIVINIDSVHIIGVNSLSGNMCRLISAEDNPIFELSGVFPRRGFIEIAGFVLTGGATHGAIEVAAAADATRGCIHDCWINTHGASQDGIFVPNGATLNSCIIFNNWFGYGATRSGIEFAGSGYHSMIYNNYFRVYGAGAVRGIHVVFPNAQIGPIKDNVFSIHTDDQAGKAIQIENTGIGIGGDVQMIVGNKAGQGAVAMTNNPYRDLSTGAAETSNPWVMNYEGNAVMYPDFA